MNLNINFKIFLIFIFLILLISSIYIYKNFESYNTLLNTGLNKNFIFDTSFISVKKDSTSQKYANTHRYVRDRKRN